MKRRTSTAPVRIYTYGCRLPTENADLVERQLLLAHRYYNTLIEIERRRREKVREAQSQSATIIAELETRIQIFCDAIEKGYAQINDKKGDARTNKVEIEAERLALDVLRDQRKRALEELKAAKVDARTPELLARFKEIGEEAEEEVRQARGSCGVYFGTYLLVEKAVQAARQSKTDPEFHRWVREMAKLDDSGNLDDGGLDGRGCSGRIGVHLQASSIACPTCGSMMTRQRRDERHPKGAWRCKCGAVLDTQDQRALGQQGISVADVMAGKDSRILIDPPAKNLMSVVHFRIGTDDDGAPIYAEFPFRYHRPLPADGRVKDVAIVKSVKGRWVNWDLQFTLEVGSLYRSARPASDGGVVAIDIGWRKRPTDDDLTNLRVGYWVDDQGKRGELRIPSEIHETLKHVESIRAIYDRNFDAIRARLTEWKADHQLPEWLGKALEWLPKWKAPMRLGAVVDRWRGERFDGDEGIFVELTAWWKQHRHLYDWEACERDRTLGRRKMQYRRWAAELTKRYAVVVLEDFDLREVAELQAPDATKENLPRQVRRNRTVAACSEFVNAIKHAAPKNGCTIALEEMADTTAKCSSCGHVQRFDHRLLAHACERCGGETGAVDQDRNAAQNLLAAWVGKQSRSQTAAKETESIDGSDGAIAKPAQGAVP